MDIERNLSELASTPVSKERLGILVAPCDCERPPNNWRSKEWSRPVSQLVRDVSREIAEREKAARR